MYGNKEDVLAQIDALFETCGASANTKLPGWQQLEHLGTPGITLRTTRAMAILDRFASPRSEYRRAAQEPFENGHDSGDAIALSRVLGALAAFRADVEAGHAQSVAELIHADVFADFLEMADELHRKGFKDPAAVLAGSVLEEHLRKLARKSGIPSQDAKGKPLNAERFNQGLASAGIYNKLEQKNVTAWLALRNNAAHGKHDEYDPRQVAALIQSVRDFLVRNPA